ncbi:MAG: phosphoglucosamine mutase [Planctomycetes bacterium]|nr:phosphoglucosamine mutase [Planctomycetota bacterium]
MVEQLIISVSGMRGIVGKNLTDSVVADYGRAFGTFLKESYSEKKENFSVSIGRDSRASGKQLFSSVAEGLCDVGINVIDLGIVTTPSVGIMLRELGCVGGLVITASHNPGQYNGIKLLLSNGVAPPSDAAKQIRQYYFNKHFGLVDSSDCGKVTSSEQADITHIDKVLAIIDRRAIAAKKFKVVLDSVNGAGGRITKLLLDELGCEVSAINDEPTGLFAHAPEPIAENLQELCEIVKTEGAEIGFAQDPDADRLAIVDEHGTYISEEYSLALSAKYIFSKKTGKAATNLSTSRMIDDIAEKVGGQVIRTAVGEAHVAAAMFEHDCIIGGEGNGGVIDLRIGPIRDSLVGIAFVLQLMAETGKTVSQLVDEIGAYCMIKDKFTADKSQAQRIFSLAKEAFVDAKLNTTDGCRFDFGDGWLHLRASNTEPVIRIIVEAKDRHTAEKYVNTVSKIRKEVSDS